MDALFGDDSDEEGVDARAQALWIELAKNKPALKRRLPNKVMQSESELVLQREVAVVGESVPLEWLERVGKAGFVSAVHQSLEQVTGQCDVLVLFDSVEASEAAATRLKTILASGAVLISSDCGDWANVLPESDWLPLASSNISCLCFRRRAVGCNTSGAIYWGATTACPQLDSERALLEELSVTLTVQERRLGILSDSSLSRASQALSKHGLCIFCGIVDPKVVLEWGTAARADMAQIVTKLRERGIDLLRPGQAGQPRIENFHEMSMREALRCDIRNGHAMTELARRADDVSVAGSVPAASSASSAAAVAGAAQWTPASLSLRGHPAVREVLQELMNPIGDPENAKGNWGRWNFEGAGPEGGPPELAIGQVGAVMSLPGCADQTIHADTAHLYTHAQLPGHYFNLFFPAVRPEDGTAAFSVGQTAFVAGSHELAVSAKVMTQAGGQEELNRRLVRPHLQAGDALLFDCRALHFGLANQTADATSEEAGADGEAGVMRPLLYINHHQQWFVDPKNWNDHERLFETVL